MRKKSILINAGMVTAQPSGVGVYSVELLKQLIPCLQREGFETCIYCYDITILNKLNIGNIKKVSLGFLLDKLLKNKEVIHRHIWNLIALNFISRKFDVLYSFTSHGTLFHPRQIITIHDVICL